MLVINENSYVTIDEADEYVKTHFFSDDECRIKWESLTDEDKEAGLIRSTQALDSLKYKGKKRGAQKLQFPRYKHSGIGGILYMPYVSQFYDSSLIRSNGPLGDEDGMIAIKKATIENAVALAYLNKTIQANKISRIQGLSSMRMGNVHKTYNTNNKSVVNSENDIFTEKIWSILVDWLESSKYAI